VTSLRDDSVSVPAAAAHAQAVMGFGRKQWHESRDQNDRIRGMECVKGGVIGVLLRRDGSCERLRKLGI
jgi:hypothetical protein